MHACTTSASSLISAARACRYVGTPLNSYGWCASALPQLYPDYLYSIVRLLRPEHVIEQWQEQQREAAERAAAAAAAQQQFTIPAEPAATGAAGSPQLQAEAAAARLANGGGGALAASGTVKQPPGQGAQAKFALTSAFVEKVRTVQHPLELASITTGPLHAFVS